MSKTFLYSIQDTKAGTFSPPFVSPNGLTAGRQFQIDCKNEQTLLNKYPEDFQLMEIGVMDMDTGKITPAEQPIMIVTAVQALHTHEAA